MSDLPVRMRSAARAAAPAVAVIVVQLVLFPVRPGVWVQGLVSGLLNSLVVLGMMLVYRANRVVNLAQASIGTYPAALAIGLFLFGAPAVGVTLGMGAVAALLVAGCAVALLGWSWRRAAVAGAVVWALAVAGLQVDAHLGYWGALLTGLVTAVGVGLGIDAIVVARFRRSPRLVLTVATIGLAQFFAVGALLVPRLWGEVQLATANERHLTVPWTVALHLGSTTFSGNDIVAVVVSLGCLVAVTTALRRSDVGIAVRASAERADRASMLGVPVPQVEAGVWVVASVLAFLGTFLQAGILNLEITAGVGLRVMVAALAALALAGFESLPVALASAVAIGVLSQATGPAGGGSVTHTDTVLAVVVLVGLLGRRASSRRADRQDVSSWQSSVEPRAVPRELAGLREIAIVRWGGGALALAAAIALPLVLTESQTFRAATVGALAVLALSVVVLTGWAGEVTLGQMAFAAAGAAVAAYATATWQWDLTLVLVAAGLSGAVLAVVVGLPSLRWQGIFLAVTTLAFAQAAAGYLFNPTEMTWIPTDAVLRRPLLGIWSLSGDSAMYEVVLAVLLIALVAVAGIRRSRTGRVLRAVRDNAPGAQAYGVRLVQARLGAFALSGFLAGVGGALLMYVSEGYDVATFGAEQGLNVFIASVVGGVGSAVGALLGAGVLDGSRTFLSGDWALLPSAVGVLVVLLVLPGGLAELLYRIRDGFLRRLALRHGIDVPSLTADRADRAEPGAGATVAGAPAERPALPAVPGWLSVRGLDVAYDKVQVLFGVDIDIPRGQITALLGTNGAGKSTLLRAIGGVAPVTGGSIELDGQDLAALAPHDVPRQGIAQMPGGQGVFPSLTVDENLRVAAWLLRADRAEVAARTESVLERFPILRQRAGDAAGDLSGGQQQQLALAMALLARPALLLVDELSLGLAPVVVDQLLVELRALRDAGTTIVVVEQSVNVALTVADHAYFMEKGEVRFSGDAADLLAQPDLVRSVYLQGARDALATPTTPTTPTPSNFVPEAVAGDGQRYEVREGGTVAAVSVSGLAVSFGGIAAVDRVSFEVQRGEVVGLIGPNGAGKTTVFDLISGFTAAHAGRVEVLGQDLTHRSPSGRARLGLARSFQDARLFGGLTVAETIAVALERWVQISDPISSACRLPASQLTEAAVRARVEELIELFGLQAFADKRVGDLSTGSRRMVDLACVVAHQPSVVLLDEPTSGIAQREAEALGPLLLGLRDRLGASLLVIEHDIALISSISDRLVALDQGAVVTIGAPAEVLDHPQVVASYLGGNDDTVHRSHHTPGASS